ncbi:cyclin-domain-containing protein [Lipomyces arxii]|uniref:cyclin-domain-containing protein n=1 Tax=Lipomyces arxii TaxID=56418 RepID=UPI0034CD80B1
MQRRLRNIARPSLRSSHTELSMDKNDDLSSHRSPPSTSSRVTSPILAGRRVSKRVSIEQHEPSPRSRAQQFTSVEAAYIKHDSQSNHTHHDHIRLHKSLSPTISRQKSKEVSKSPAVKPAEAGQPESLPIPAAANTPQPKVLPSFYFDCDTPDLLVLISSMLSELIKLNDAIPLVSSQLTRFHSRAPPLISHRDYLHRLTRFCSLEKSALLSMVFYIDLLCTVFSSFTINSLTVHRFLITAATVASKGLCDSFCTNAHYARVGGVSLPELNLLEVEFLVRVGWRVVPPVNTLEEYYRRMVSRLAQMYTIAPEVPELQDETKLQQNENDE